MAVPRRLQLRSCELGWQFNCHPNIATINRQSDMRSYRVAPKGTVPFSLTRKLGQSPYRDLDASASLLAVVGVCSVAAGFSGTSAGLNTRWSYTAKACSA